jgi:3D (Asp-Asp-Asp) domain-containing protein
MNYIFRIIGAFVISLLAFFIVPKGIALECSDGWYVTGYFTPDESNYSGEKVEVAVTNPQGETSNREFYKAFIDVVKVEGFGKTLAGDYLGGDDNEWHSETGDLDRFGEPLKVGITVAVDPNIVPFGTELSIPSLPKPWSDHNFTATDEGVDGRHIDVFTGEGSKAEQETFRITGQNHTVCLS